MCVKHYVKVKIGDLKIGFFQSGFSRSGLLNFNAGVRCFLYSPTQPLEVPQLAIFSKGSIGFFV